MGRFRQGDIVFADLNPSAGHEQQGRRPLLVISNESLNRTGLAMICPITSRQKEGPARVKLSSGKVQGDILTDQVRTLDLKARRAQFAERCTPLVVGEVIESVKTYLSPAL